MRTRGWKAVTTLSYLRRLSKLGAPLEKANTLYSPGGKHTRVKLCERTFAPVWAIIIARRVLGKSPSDPLVSEAKEQIHQLKQHGDSSVAIMGAMMLKGEVFDDEVNLLQVWIDNEKRRQDDERISA